MVKENIFANWARRYWERGIPVIPLNGKVPVVTGWVEWSKRHQTEDELEVLIERYPACNIGAVLGVWACALDIDTDDAVVLSSCPFSPYKRKGKKGAVLFFKPCEYANHPQQGAPIEFLNVGRQVVLPPSVHPETGEPYIWIGDDALTNFEPEHLPAYPSGAYTNLVELCKRRGIKGKERKLATTGDKAPLMDAGRNNKLTAMSYAMACDAVPETEAIERLLAFDAREHDVPWFSDKSEPHKGRDPRKHAMQMVKRAMAAAEKKGNVRPVISGDLVLVQPPPKTDLWRPYPAPRGLMRLFVEYCQATSIANQDALGLGGAIALMSVICANRFRSQIGTMPVWPNMYILNIAPSGFGKETAQRTIDTLLNRTKLLGSGNYKSGTSIVMELPKQQERLDIIDECSSLLKTMSGKESYQSEIVDLLSALFTKGDSRYIGMASKAQGSNFGACWNPCVSILGSTTPTGLKSSVTKEMAAKGLMPRFLLFYQFDVGEYRMPKDVEAADTLLNELRRRVRLILSVDKNPHPDSEQQELLPDEDRDESTRWDPELIPMSANAQKRWEAFSRHYFELSKKDVDSFASCFYARFAQVASKLALLDAISLGMSEVTTDSLEWAIAVVETQWANAQSLYEVINIENKNEQDIVRVEQIVRRSGSMTMGQLYQKARWLTAMQRRDAISHLVSEGLVEIQRVQSGSKSGRPTERVIWIGS